MPTSSTTRTFATRSLAGAALLGLVLALAACGSDGDTADEAAEATSPPPTESDLASEPDTAGGSEDGEEDEPIDATADDSAEASPPAAGGFSLNGFRYCEILVTLDGDDGAPVTEVWGTPGVGPCLDEAWYALDPDEVMADFGASSIHMNGPRFFTVDGFVDTAESTDDDTTDDAAADAEVRDLGGISMTLLATVDEPTSESVPYQPGIIVRTVTMSFNAGTEVYELTDPDGNTYVMQSYALIVDPELKAEDLPTLGDRLQLPDGWTYSARTLDENLQLGLAPEGAIVVQDELENSYQRNVIAGDDSGAAGAKDS